MSRRGGHGGHGGAWKVANADFVTAMMALFIVLWILAQKPETAAAVAAYFNHPSILESSGSGFLSAEGMQEFKSAVEKIRQEAAADSARTVQAAVQEIQKQGPITPEELAERGLLASSATELEKMLNGSEALRQLKGQISIEFTSQGLRIQIEDLTAHPLFDLGSAEPTPRGKELLLVVARVLQRLPNLILVEGHTDARPFSKSGTYTNWELSGDRANAARRVLEAGGVPADRIARVVGYADRRLLTPNDPLSEHNRRISIIVCYQNAHLD
jgi:chemotaxis protein MotB